jgi:protein-tyrosine phosphatase
MAATAGATVDAPVIDLHCHVLPGIDDGPRTLEDSVALARAAVAAGTRSIVATPHVSWEYPNDSATIAELVATVNDRLAAEGLPLDVLPGAEIAVTRVSELEPDELEALRLGGGPWLLVECPYTSAVAGFDTLLLRMQDRGHRIVLAHPERAPAFQRDPEALARLVHSGMLTSVTAGSFAGRFGREVRRSAQRLAEMGLVHNVASDAHDAVRRPPGIAGELEGAGLGLLADWLAHAVPEAILAGREIPPRPAVVTRPAASRSGRAWRRR